MTNETKKIITKRLKLLTNYVNIGYEQNDQLTEKEFTEHILNEVAMIMLILDCSN